MTIQMVPGGHARTGEQPGIRPEVRAGEPGVPGQPGIRPEPRTRAQPRAAEHEDVSAARLRRVFGAFPTGVTVIAALVDGTPVGLTANSFTAVSLDPPLLSVCVAHTSTTWPLLADRARLGVTVLGAEQESAGSQLASRRDDRFAGLDWYETAGGAVLLDGAGAWFETSIEQQIRAGDHDIVLLRIRALDADHAVPPLVFHGSRFRRLEQSAADNGHRPAPRPTPTQEPS